MEFGEELFAAFNSAPSKAQGKKGQPEKKEKQEKNNKAEKDKGEKEKKAEKAKGSKKRKQEEAPKEKSDEVKGVSKKKKGPKEKDESEDTEKKVKNKKYDLYNDYAEQKVVQREAGERCTSEVCYPPRWDFAKEVVDEKERQNKPKPKAAKEYPFTLDDFQRASIDCLERGQSVLVSAHTSAGKTVVAEYAIAMSLRDGQRVVYTSPIKALSNQKYRELSEEFKDVGLMTGDVTINPSASCLVMTTEILRNMLYRGNELLREVAWVIFDEIHYMRDRERGVVWEETIILLPDKVHYVFLSATIPNASEFALWIAKLHNQPCNVVYTDFRPVPLQHYIFPSGADGLYLVVDEKEQFREENFQRALSALAKTPLEQEATEKKKKKKKSGGADIYKIVRLIMEHQYYPAIVFSFSKRECEAHALRMPKLDFCDVEEKKLIEQIFTNAIDNLSDDDKKLPQVESILPLLKRGIGIHHGGLLPLLKEVTEILFQEGLLKVLFSTETFSMGLNMPAKTVVFTAASKFDGQQFRMISSGEYIQMSGRAGRRGLDDRGIVVLMADEQLEPPVVRNMIKGSADALNSTFHLKYNMVLNLIRVEEADPEYIMGRSFYQYQMARKAPKLKQEIGDLEKKKEELVIKDAKGIGDYHHIKSQLFKCKEAMHQIITKPMNILPFLNPGRLVHVVDGELDYGWGILVNFQKKKLGLPPARPDKGKSEKPEAAVSVDGSDFSYILDVLLHCKKDTDAARSGDEAKTKIRSKIGFGPSRVPLPLSLSQDGEMLVVPCLLHLVQEISSVRLFIPKDLRSSAGRQSTGRSLREVVKRFPDGLPKLDPIEDMKIKDDLFLQLIRKVESLEDRLLSHPLHNDPHLKTMYQKFLDKLSIEENIGKAKKSLKDITQDIGMQTTLKNMKRVLRRLGHLTAENVITMKGRVACEISTCDELLGTELILGGVFNSLTPEQSVAILSCLCFDEKAENDVKLKEELASPLRQIQEAARRIGQVILDAKLPLELETYVEQFQPNMMDIVYQWCKGAKFAEICKITNIFEGSIIRCLRRLEELLRQMATAAKAIGEKSLEDKFLTGITLLKRDIAFSASLYT